MLQTTATTASIAAAIKGGRRLAASGCTHRSGREGKTEHGRMVAPWTDGWPRRMVGRAGWLAAPKSRRRRNAGSAGQRAADGGLAAPDKGPQQDDGPWTADG